MIHDLLLIAPKEPTPKTPLLVAALSVPETEHDTAVRVSWKKRKRHLEETLSVVREQDVVELAGRIEGLVSDAVALAEELQNRSLIPVYHITDDGDVVVI